MDQADLIHHIFYFISLEMADKMPADILGQLLVLVAELLHLILAKIPRAARKQLLYHGNRLGFADRNQSHLIPLSACALTGCLHPLFYLFQILHYHFCLPPV